MIVATGFIAKNPQGQVTTLKRNGSDYSATIVGALVRGSHITIWTDVDGVFSADPRKVFLNVLHESSAHQFLHSDLTPLMLSYLLCPYATLAMHCTRGLKAWSNPGLGCIPFEFYYRM